MSCLKYAICQNCQLASSGKPGKLVHSRGTSEAKIAIVGEAPGALDVSKKRVWFEHTPTGQFVDQMLGACGIRKNEVYYANALLCNYPSGTKPGKRTVEACRSRLDYELKQLSNLRVIVACGKYALQSLLDKEKITQELYNIYWSDKFNAYIIPSYHPAFVLRNIEGFEDVAWVFQTARQFMDSSQTGPLPHQALDRYTARNAEEALDFLERIAEIATPTDIAVDCEADDVNWVRTPMLAIGFAIKDETGYTAYTIPWINQDNPPEVSSDVDFFVTPEMVLALEKIARNPNLRFCWHNGTFDVKLIAQNTGIFFRIDEDTMLLHYNIDERGGGDSIEGIGSGTKIGSHRLKTIAKKYLLIPDWEGDIKQFLKSKKTSYSHIPRKKLHEYLGYDVVYCLMLVYKLKEISIADDEPSPLCYMHPLDEYHQIKIPAQNEITLVEFEGVRINEKRRRQLSTEMRKKINDLYAEMVLHVRKLEGRDGPPPPRITKLGKLAKDQPLEFNPRSPRDLKKLIYDTLGVQLTKDLKTTEKGAPIKSKWPTGRSVLLKLRNRHPVIECLIQYKLTDKQYGTYVKSLKTKMDSRGHIHTELLLAVTRTSRLASRNPNTQNLTKDIKELYIPDEDPNASIV